MKPKKTICLNMIVKDESPVIQRCLSTVKHLIDYWVIVDTGSTDGTQEIIRKYLKEIPGELHERPFVNFGHNRNEALALARGKTDYFLFIDADDRLIFSDTFAMPDLDKDFYFIIQRMRNKDSTADLNHPIIALIKDRPGYAWTGVLHEALTGLENGSHATLQGVVNEYLHDGHRSHDPDKSKKDIQILKEALWKDPTNSRNVFLLAHLYKDSGDYLSAIKYYERRAAMGGREDEIFYSLYAKGLSQRMVKYPPAVFLKTFSRAFHQRPSRVEPLLALGEYFIESKHYFLAYLVTKFALSLPFSAVSHDIYIEPWIYNWGIHVLFFQSALGLKKYKEAYQAIQTLLANPEFPSSVRKQIEHCLPQLKLLIGQHKLAVNT